MVGMGEWPLCQASVSHTMILVFFIATAVLKATSPANAAFYPPNDVPSEEFLLGPSPHGLQSGTQLEKTKSSMGTLQTPEFPLLHQFIYPPATGAHIEGLSRHLIVHGGDTKDGLGANVQAQPVQHQGPVALSSLRGGKAGVFSSVFGGMPLTPKEQQGPAPLKEPQGPQQWLSEAAAGASVARLADGSIPAPKLGFTLTHGVYNEVERPQPFTPWGDAQPNNVLLITLADATLFQGLCCGKVSDDPRVPCGVAYPGIPTLALHLALGPLATDGATKQYESPKQPAVLLSTAASDGIEASSGFVDSLLYRAWQAEGNGDCTAGDGGRLRWGAGSVTNFSRSSASQEASALTSLIDNLIVDRARSGIVDRSTRMIYLGSSRTSEYAAVASMVASEPRQLVGAYLTIAGEANSASRRGRVQNTKRSPKPSEFIFRRGALSIKGVRLDFSVTIAGAHLANLSTSRVPAELKIAVGDKIATCVRQVVDWYLSVAFDEQDGGSQRPLSPEMPVLFVRVERVRLVRDASAGQGRVVSVDLKPYSGTPMDDLGVPIVLYTTAVGAAFQGYVLGHLKSSGLTSIIRQTFMDTRSVGPLHQPALAGHVAAQRNDVTRLLTWLRRAGPRKPITLSMERMSNLLLESHAVASDLQEKCKTAAASLDLPVEDPMLRFATLFCDVYPQTYFLHSICSEELEVYSLELGLVAGELLEVGGSLEDGMFGASSLTLFENDLDQQRRRLGADDDSSDEDEEGAPLVSQYLTLPEDKEEAPSPESSGMDNDKEPASPFTAPTEVTAESPPASPVDEDDAFQASLPDTDGASSEIPAGTGETVEVGRADRIGAGPIISTGTTSSSVEEPPEAGIFEQGRDGGNDSMQQNTVDQLSIEERLREIERQGLQHQLLLERIATQQEQGRLIQEQYKQVVQPQHQQRYEPLHQSAPQNKGSSAVEGSSHRDEGTTNSSELLGDAKTGGSRHQWKAEKTPAVTFPGINDVYEGDQAVKEWIRLHERQMTRKGSSVGGKSQLLETWQRLELRYGPLFLNFASFILKDNTLEDLIQVAEWHVNSSAHRNLCKQRKFSLFSFSRLEGRFRLVSRIIDLRHRNHSHEVMPYKTSASVETWRRALEGLKEFQRLFRSLAL